MFHWCNNSCDKAKNAAETATLHSGECFRNGHFAPKTGRTSRGKARVKPGQAASRSRHRSKGLGLTLGPIALNDLIALMMGLQPVVRGLVKRQALRPDPAGSADRHRSSRCVPGTTAGADRNAGPAAPVPASPGNRRTTSGSRGYCSAGGCRESAARGVAPAPDLPIATGPERSAGISARQVSRGFCSMNQRTYSSTRTPPKLLLKARRQPALAGGFGAGQHHDFHVRNAGSARHSRKP